jgi:uncharacterized membrane protein YsdA (DUF1294 family)
MAYANFYIIWLTQTFILYGLSKLLYYMAYPNFYIIWLIQTFIVYWSKKSKGFKHDKPAKLRIPEGNDP